MRITFKQLEIFNAVARNKNMVQAAESLHISQSACSMALTKLECQLNGFLFDRYGKQLILNDRGKFLLPKIKNIIDQVQELQNAMIGDEEKLPVGHLTIGASSTIGNYILPKIIGKFLNENPKIKIALQVGNTEQVICQLLKYEIDFGMVEGNCYHTQIKTLPWRIDELIVIASPNSPLCKQKNMTQEELYNAKWIVRELGSGTREKFEEATSRQITPFLELGHTEAIKQAVKSGLGISCLSRIVVADALKNGDLVEIKTPFLKLARNFYILIHKEKYLTASINALIKKILNQDECSL